MTLRCNNVPWSYAGGTVTAKTSSLGTGSQVWFDGNCATQTVYYESNSAVNQANLAAGLSNVTAGNATASGYPSGRIPIATVLGGATADQWTVTGGNVSPHNEPNVPFALNLLAGAGISTTTDANGSETLSSQVTNFSTPAATHTFTTVADIFVCTTTCTITVPVPSVANSQTLQYCVMNDDNVSTVITLSAIGSSASYENTARTAYGTAGTGTFVSGGAVGDMVCIVARDSTHYLTPTYKGTWTAH
jgi:hypothetical protein